MKLSPLFIPATVILLLAGMVGACAPTVTLPGYGAQRAGDSRHWGRVPASKSVGSHLGGVRSWVNNLVR